MTGYCMDCESTGCDCYDMVADTYQIAFDTLWSHGEMLQDGILIAFVELANDCLKSKDEHIVERAKATMTRALVYFMRDQQRGR